MKLLIDLGNSRLKWGVDGGTGPRSVGALARAGRSAEALAATVAAAVALPAPPAEVRVASVAGPEPTAALATALARRFGAVVRLARSAAAAPGITNGYREPRQLGVDRWLALRAAFRADARAACIVAAGTACTLDLAGPGGTHRGGLIVPGLALMQAALRGGTGDLAARAAADPPAAALPSAGGLPLVAAATGAAMEAGARWALATLIRHHAAALRAEFPDARLLLTGGDAAVLQPLLPADVEHHPDLILAGLACDPFAGEPGPGPSPAGD
jgi:type III pantothenate kinase